MPTLKTLTILTGACMSAAMVGCNLAEPPPFDPRAMQQLERQRAGEVESRPKRPLPTTLESPFLIDERRQTTGPATAPTTGPALESDVTVRMPLQEIIQRAVINNLDVKVAGYAPAIEETRVTEAEARFDPTFFSNLQYQKTDREQGLFATGNARQIQSQTGVRQILNSGGQIELRNQLSWVEPVGGGGFFTPTDQFWENEVVLEVTQPLLRDFGNEINRARITINRNNQRISLLDFRKQLEETATDIERTYWQLVAAERAVRINERLLDETYRTADILFKRRGQDVTRVQLSQANASIEQRRATLIRAKARVRDLSDQLKRLMNDPQMPVSSGVLILPANAPLEEPVHFDLQDQINTALENRFELGQQQLRIDSASVAAKVGKNNLLPQLNLIGSLGIQGLDQDLGEAVEDQLNYRNQNYTIGIQFEIPIGNRAARAIYQRALLQRQQAIEQYRNLIEQIALDVKTALREVDTTWEEMVATRQARFAAEDALLAIEQREAGGEALTPTFVQLKLDTQERLAQARTAEVEAISNYNIAIARLEQAKGTLLRYNNIVMEEEKLPIGYRSGK
ncbi:MAG TPA: TolC family protein [Tepidisphaeraceae bacterium]|nr:TolC family protein [Tepidisphaeraceae bacterium]